MQFTMQQAVLHHFPEVQATYRFTHRDKDVFFTRKCIEAFQSVVYRKCILYETCSLIRLTISQNFLP